MPTHTNKETEKTGANQSDLHMDYGSGTFQMQDNRPETMVAKTIQRMVNARLRPADNDVVQRYPTPIEDEDAMALRGMYDSDLRHTEEEDVSTEQIAEIKSNVFSLTPLRPEGIEANCIGWAKEENSIEPVNNIYLWKKDYTEEPNLGSAKIILWGKKKDPTNTDKWKVLHASVKLSHAEIEARSKEFSGFNHIKASALSDAGIDNPCWTSVGGSGLGAIVHPRDWFEGGVFGTVLMGLT